MYRAPVTVLDKVLPTGQRLVLRYASGGYTATVNGRKASAGFTTWVKPNADQPQAPYLFEVPVPPGGVQGLECEPDRFGVPVALTSAEAEAVRTAALEYRLGPGRRALEAVPGARTWTLDETVLAMEVGAVYRAEGGQAMTVLAVATRHIHEDGHSLGLGEEEGDVYVHTVREATAAEAEFLQAREADEGRVRAALAQVKEEFAWGHRARPARDVSPAAYEDTTGGEQLYLGGRHPGSLVRHADRIVSVTVGTSVMDPSAYWSHPRTPERDEVFDALLVLDPHTSLH